jgi:hypothetical protein
VAARVLDYGCGAGRHLKHCALPAPISTASASKPATACARTAAPPCRHPPPSSPTGSRPGMKAPST